MAEVFRDDLGIPHIRATDVRDLAEAQGEVTARDRGWQIEIDRLRAAGRLSELIGESGVVWDVFARRARLDDTARRAFDALGEEDRAFVSAYAGGVRRGMDAAGSRAAEFRVLDETFGDTRPLTAWDDHDPLGVLHVAHALFSTFPHVLWRERVALALGDEWVDLFAGDSGEETTPTAGSNAWALHGSRTASGMPLLAGDPHRIFELPGVYQQVRLACDEFDVIGLAFPGVPGVPHFGHTGDAAWGITNAIAHSVDVFEERLRTVQGGYAALGPRGWEPVDVHRSLITVRGGDTIEVESLETARGCIVTDPHPHDGGLRAWSIRHPARTNADLGAGALLPLLRARTAQDVISAFGRWVDPVNRVLAADRGGDVLSATVGTVPRRERDERRRAHSAASVAPAPDRDRVGAVVVRDVAVDANERPSAAAIDLGWAYPSSHRASRIARLLADLAPRTPADFEPIWGDTASGSTAPLRALLPSPDASLSPAAVRVRDLITAWDGRMDAGSEAAGAFGAWRDALVQETAAHPTLAPLREPHPFGAVFDPWMGVEGQIAAVLPRLLQHPALRDDAPDLVRRALERAADADTWGSTHRMLPTHVLADVPRATAPVAGLDIELSGDGDAVRCTGSTPGLTDRAWRGSVARWAWDLADREQSLWSVPFGAAGAPDSPHFSDQLDDWAAVRPTRVVTDWAALHADTPTGAS